MIIEDLIEIRNSLLKIYPNLKVVNSLTLLRFTKDVLIKEKNNFTIKELLELINQVFEVKIRYENFYNFYAREIKNVEIEKSKKRIKNVKIEKNENKEEISSSENEEPKKIDDNIVSKKEIDDKNKSVRVNLPKIQKVNVGLIESSNRDRIK